MTKAAFFRLLEKPVDAKDDALARQITMLNEMGIADETYDLDPGDLALIPGSPFAYWTGYGMRLLFEQLSQLGDKVDVRQGLATADDFRFLRAWWEVAPATIGYSIGETIQGCKWCHFAKGGPFSPFYTDVHLVVDWENNGLRLRSFEKAYIRNEDSYFRPGLTWPRRTQKGLNVRALPAGCIFGDKGPSVFCEKDDLGLLLRLLSITNSTLFRLLVELQMAFGSYEVGVIKRTPVPEGVSLPNKTLEELAYQAYELGRLGDVYDETTHAFSIPALVEFLQDGLAEGSRKLETARAAQDARLDELSASIDDDVFSFYGFADADRQLVLSEMGQRELASSALKADSAEHDNHGQTTPEDLVDRVQELLLWCVGSAYGRWDLRFAVDSSLLPSAQSPFDPLPRWAPGALVGADGLPPASSARIAPKTWLRARKNVLDIPPGPTDDGTESVYPVSIAWDGILVDDPGHPADLVGRVREILALLWGDRAGAIEREACQILGFDSLRDYFRDPRKGFFPFHIKRYSKSRRKAPIYWLLQSENRNYAIWLYYHRMDESTYFTAARDYADTKVALEATRLEELHQGLAALSGTAQKWREREIDLQQKLVAEVTNFRDKLDEIALRQLPPDHNDGVIISIAPLWELVPWKEAEKMWRELVAGKHEWSTMAQQMRKRGFVKGK